jgi:hypothetical protein
MVFPFKYGNEMGDFFKREEFLDQSSDHQKKCVQWS